MSRSDRQIDDMLDALVSLSRKVGKQKAKGDERLYAVELLAQKFKRARTRDKSGSAIPDGYPRGSSFDGAGGGTQFEVAADRFEGESRIGLTSVELAIEQRVFSQKSYRDHHHELYQGAEADLERAVRAIDEMRSKLARIDNLIDQNPNQNPHDGGCRSCARYRDASGREYFSPASKESGGRRGMCQWCLGWVSDAVANPEGTFPPVELIERRARGERITTKVLDEVKAAAKRKVHADSARRAT